MYVIAILISLALCNAVCSKEYPHKTVDCVKAAYRDELSDSMLYKSFAHTAFKEGYPDIARLFIGYSQQEYQHALGYLSLMDKLGARPPTVDTREQTGTGTRENIRQLVLNENHDVSVLYRDFINTAKNDRQIEALQFFREIRQADQQKLSQFKNIMSLPGLWKKKKNITVEIDHAF